MSYALVRFRFAKRFAPHKLCSWFMTIVFVLGLAWMLAQLLP
jgi:hypothetical protein